MKIRSDDIVKREGGADAPPFIANYFYLSQLTISHDFNIHKKRIVLYSIMVFRLTFSTLLKMLFSTYGLVFFNMAINFFVSRRYEEVVPSS